MLCDNGSASNAISAQIFKTLAVKAPQITKAIKWVSKRKIRTEILNNAQTF
ncbi:hypothetical protein LV84_04308, partial [Algoriphagus ratkowskyi]